jgi:hypothetical protein
MECICCGLSALFETVEASVAVFPWPGAMAHTLGSPDMRLTRTACRPAHVQCVEIITFATLQSSAKGLARVLPAK